jgi:hypothetical protein
MIETNPLSVLVAGIIMVFSLAFWLTSKDERCWYRRYLLPMMVASFALVLPDWWGKIFALVSAALIYDGYQGFGRKIRAQNEKSK